MNYFNAKLEPADMRKLVGKTIASIDDSACNVTVINFTDETSVAVESHHGFNGVDVVTWMTEVEP